jgi:hypothetical protein
MSYTLSSSHNLLHGTLMEGFGVAPHVRSVEASGCGSLGRGRFGRRGLKGGAKSVNRGNIVRLHLCPISLNMKIFFIEV